MNNGTSVFIEKMKPNESEVIGFIDNFEKRRREYLIDLYLKVDGSMDYQLQVQNLIWLRNIRVIDRSVYETNLVALDRIFGKSKNQNIGFH